MFICRVHAAPNEAQDVLFAESINAPRLMALSVSESTLSTRSLLIVQDGLCRRLAHKCRGSSPRRAPAEPRLDPAASPSEIAALRFVYDHLRRRLAHFKLGAHFLQAGSRCLNLLLLLTDNRFQVLHLGVSRGQSLLSTLESKFET